MRLLTFLLGILLLRRLPGGKLGSWLIRLAIWSGLIALAIKRLRPYLSETPATAEMQAPSGWTATAESAAPAEAYEPANVPAGITATPQGATAGAPEAVETITETITVSTEIWGAPSEQTSGLEPAPQAAKAEEPLAESQPDEPLAPRWVRGNGMLDCPEGFPVKAKINSNIYYEPGAFHYSVAIPDVCFASAEDAAAAGYRAPRR